jgi:hypothetical protein
MSRLLSNQPCEVTFEDRISGSEITLFYRLPTTEELIQYSNALLTRKGKKIISQMGQARQIYGAKILVGFKEGCFRTEKGPLSSDQASEHYDEKWKEHIKQYAPDIIEALAMHVFEAGLTVKSDEEEDSEEDAENP